jgi:predicted  nucleic acid-binding Zn-ribbon protein
MQILLSTQTLDQAEQDIQSSEKELSEVEVTIKGLQSELEQLQESRESKQVITAFSMLRSDTNIT